MKKFAFAVIAALAISGCSDSDTARKALKGAGYSNIETHGYSVWGCSQDDSFSTKFTAKGPNGDTVKGAVCSGWFKGATIRTF